MGEFALCFKSSLIVAWVWPRDSKIPARWYLWNSDIVGRGLSSTRFAPPTERLTSPSNSLARKIHDFRNTKGLPMVQIR